MSNLIKRYATSLWSQQSSLLLAPTSHSTANCCAQFQRSFFTSPILQGKTVKRRKRYPFFWLQDKYRAYYDEQLTPQNEEFFKQFLEDRYSLDNGASPLEKEPWQVDQKFTEHSVRTGILAQKLGSFPMWSKKGVKISTTCLMVSDNHVIKYNSPEDFAKKGRPLDAKKHPGMGCIIVGADSKDPRAFTAEYNGLFEDSGVMPKRKLTRFFITDNAKIEPGTPLFASHFKPGMYVDIYGKTKEFGRVGLRLRYKLKLGRDTHGVTKAHNRIGSIGRGRKWAGPLKGRKMPGHYGGERRIVPGLKVWRVNTKYNLIYLQGHNVPGEFGSYISIMDSRLYGKKLTAESNPPFPTISSEENSKLDADLFDVEVHKPSEPSIVFEVTEEEKRAAALALRRYGKAKTAQKLR